MPRLNRVLAQQMYTWRSSFAEETGCQSLKRR